MKYLQQDEPRCHEFPVRGFLNRDSIVGQPIQSNPVSSRSAREASARFLQRRGPQHARFLVFARDGVEGASRAEGSAPPTLPEAEGRAITSTKSDLHFWHFWQFWQLFLLCSALLLTSCSKHQSTTQLSPKAYGVQITEVGGSKQIATVGSSLPQPVVVQVNDAGGNPVTGALVRFRGEGLEFEHPEALSDSSGQVTTGVRVGFAAGDYQVVAETPKQEGGNAALNLREIALGYEGNLGKAVNDKYCVRCHDNESTPERVSNFDNLSPAPHQFADGATYNRFQDSDLINITSHGGPALNKSPQMPAFGTTLKPAEIKAVVAYIRSIADPPYQSSGVKYAK